MGTSTPEYNAQRMKLQSDEFEAAGKFADATHDVLATPVVDDDYPRVRHQYEGALRELISSLKANMRF